MNTVVVPFNKEKVFLVNYASNGSAPDVAANDRITQIKAFFLDEFKVIFASQDIEKEKFQIVPTEDTVQCRDTKASEIQLACYKTL